MWLRGAAPDERTVDPQEGAWLLGCAALLGNLPEIIVAFSLRSLNTYQHFPLDSKANICVSYVYIRRNVAPGHDDLAT